MLHQKAAAVAGRTADTGRTGKSIRTAEICAANDLTLLRADAVQTGRIRLSGLLRHRFLLLHCFSGRCIVCVGGRCTAVSAGETVLTVLSEDARLLAHTGQFSVLMMGLDGAGASVYELPCRVLDSALQETAAGILRGGRPHLETVRAYAAQALEVLQPDADSAFPVTQLQLALQAYAELFEQMSQHVPIAVLADSLCISQTHLKNSFRLVYGDSLFAYIRTQKMLAAADALRGSSRTVLEIAGDYGYDNGSKFARAFQNVLGVTPREFRSEPGRETVSLRGERRHGPLLNAD